MASLENRNGVFRIVFRFGGQKFSRTLRTRDERAANLSLARLEDNLRRLELGTLSLDPDADVASALLSSGRVEQKPVGKKHRSLGQLLDAYVDGIPALSVEENSLYTIGIHVKHLKRILGSRTALAEVNHASLQTYVNSRSNEKGRTGKFINSVTIKKELSTLSSAWRWACQSEFISRPLPVLKSLRYPKTEEKPPFKTWTEIERLVSRNNLPEDKAREHWDCVFLDGQEINSLLDDVADLSSPPFYMPMLAFAAYTGARRSELIRSRMEDVDLDGGTLLIREKKRLRGQRSTRSVPIVPQLSQILERWFTIHPGGPFTFTIDSTELTKAQAQDYFKRMLIDTRWEVLRGWHVLRHSFISNCASKGVDQRMIDDWVGHQTDAMRKRYRHLFPNAQKLAISSVFND